MSIVVDMSHLMYRNIFASQGAVMENTKLTAHLLLNSLYGMVNKFEVDSQNPLVAAFDCPRKDNWRTKFYAENKNEFPEYELMKYKGNRKTDASIPWPEIYDVLNRVKLYLRDSTDVQVLDHPAAEADDIIYAVCEDARKNNGFVTIISSDSDFHQLLNRYIKQYDPIKKSFVELDFGASETLLKIDILTGQGRKDNILPCETRLGKKTALKKVKALDSLFIVDSSLRLHYEFNEKLIDLSKVPDWILEDISNQIKTINHYKFNLNETVKFYKEFGLRKLSEKITQLRFKQTKNIFDALEE